jgi:ribosome-associated protein
MVLVREVSIRDESIRLGQLLKLADLVSSGAEVKAILAAGIVTVNGEIELRRGRQIRPNDVIAVDTDEIRVITTAT